MVFLKDFTLPSEKIENELLFCKLNIDSSVYPLNLFPSKRLSEIEFAPITCFYGGNGSGKTTLLNIIATSIDASRKALENNNSLFKQYIENCRHTLVNEYDLIEKKYISSDDIFDYLLDMRAINNKIYRTKELLKEEYDNAKYKTHVDNPLDEYEELKRSVDAKRMTKSKYIRTRLKNNSIILESNGETALDYWEREIRENSIYILDEPENSLSAENQVKLAQFIEESARFYNCQFIISTHSPFILSLKDAYVYDLDDVPARKKKWTDLKNMRVYYDFFQENGKDFEGND